MSEALQRSPNLSLTADYLETAAAICADPKDEALAARLEELDKPIAELFMQGPVSVWNMSRGFEPCSLSDGILSSRKHTLDDPEWPQDGLRRDARAAFIFLGDGFPESAALDTPEYPAAYDMIRSTADEIGGGDKRFTEFTFKRIRKDLAYTHRRSRAGINFTQLDSDTLESNIVEAYKVIGYPLGILGRAAIKLNDAIPRSESRLRYADTDN